MRSIMSRVLGGRTRFLVVGFAAPFSLLEAYQQWTFSIYDLYLFSRGCWCTICLSGDDTDSIMTCEDWDSQVQNAISIYPSKGLAHCRESKTDLVKQPNQDPEKIWLLETTWTLKWMQHRDLSIQVKRTQKFLLLKNRTRLNYSTRNHVSNIR